MGLYANSAPVDVIMPWPWGATGPRAPAKASAPGLELAAQHPGGAIPHAKASGSYLNSILAKTEVANAGYVRGDPARRARLRLRGLGREHLRGRDDEILTAAAHRLDPRRDQPQW